MKKKPLPPLAPFGIVQAMPARRWSTPTGSHQIILMHVRDDKYYLRFDDSSVGGANQNYFSETTLKGLRELLNAAFPNKVEP